MVKLNKKWRVGALRPIKAEQAFKGPLAYYIELECTPRSVKNGFRLNKFMLII